MERDQALTREQQIALMIGAKARLESYAQKWDCDPRYRDIVHRFDTAATDQPELRLFGR